MNTKIKNKVLKTLADLLEANSHKIISSNQLDLESCSENDKALIDRLKVDQNKINNMITSIECIMQMPDPEGAVIYTYKKDKDLIVENRKVPFGTLLIIYESRPDVTIEAAITAFKAGNKILLKGGKEARNSNILLVELWQKALLNNKQDPNFVQYLDYDRNQTQELIKNNSKNIDIIIPRGGEQLIQSIRKNTDIPMIISGRGNNFLYIDEIADFDMATDIILDGKRRISVCNALDKVYIHNHHNVDDIKNLVNKLTEYKIEVLGDSELYGLHPCIQLCESENTYYEEFLSAKIMLISTNSMNEAIQGINKFSGGHSAVIISDKKENAEQFQNQVDCAAVYHNASSRFTDGGEFGLGAEIAISTQKLHFRGPVGLNELVTNKWFISGTGHVRG